MVDGESEEGTNGGGEMTKHTSGEVRNFIFNLDPTKTETMMLRAYATLLAEEENNEITHWNETTHYAGCIQAGPKHYECALQEIGRLRLTITHLRAELEKKTWFSAYEKKEWVGLTDDEIEHLRNDQPWWMVRDIEAKLKEKNCAG